MTARWPPLALLLLALHGCAPEPLELSVPFRAVFGQAALTCGTATAEGRLTDLRFFVSDVRLYDSDARAVQLQLAADQRWQNRSVALIDLEDGSGACKNGTPGENATLRGRVPRGDYRGISFDIGVPFELNHADPLTAEAPLDDSAMHWHWRSGYKFLRAGFENESRSHWLHLGSAACEGTIQAISHCRLPNRVTVMLGDWEPGSSLDIDLATLFNAFFASKDTRSSCSSGPAEESCRYPYDVLGLDVATGLQHTPQRLVRTSR